MNLILFEVLFQLTISGTTATTNSAISSNFKKKFITLSRMDIYFWHHQHVDQIR